MTGIYLLLGSNLGNRKNNLTEAIVHLKTSGQILSQSAIYQTAAWGKTDQPDFYNQVIHFDTNLSAHELLDSILKIEQEMGRTRVIKWGERLIDIDILLYHDQILADTNLSIPHPQLELRRFALIPLAEIAGSVIHPIVQKSIHQLLENCPDKLAVQKVI